MADKKISALDAATTPLAGTEVLPIVQSGTTKKVSVADLTAGRAITATTVNLITVGRGAGAVASNTALGSSALNANTTGTNNTVAGFQAGFSNTTGTQNTYYGSVAGFSSVTSSGNCAFGARTLETSTAQNNSAFGFAALQANTTGASNTAVGGGAFGFSFGALSANTSGSNNTALGCLANVSNQTGSNNTSVGMEALKNSTASNNTALGYQAGLGITSGSNLTVIGSTAAASAATATNEMTFGNSSVTVWRYVGSTTVGGLPSAATVGKGARSFVTDALVPTFGSAVAAGGAVFTPVYSDGTNWIVG